MAKRKDKSTTSRKSTTAKGKVSKKKAGGSKRARTTGPRKTTANAAAPLKAPVRVAAAAPAPRPKQEVVITLTHEQIAKRAFEIWLAKGRPLGQDEQNWQEAIAELKAGKK